jgi:hypothetical protein
MLAKRLAGAAAAAVVTRCGRGSDRGSRLLSIRAATAASAWRQSAWRRGLGLDAQVDILDPGQSQIRMICNTLRHSIPSRQTRLAAHANPEIGFLPPDSPQRVAGRDVGERRHRRLGGDPLVVRVGQSTFALRRAEAACVQLLPRQPAA